MIRGHGKKRVVTPPPPPPPTGPFVTFADPGVGFILGPLLPVGSASNPYPWADSNQVAKAIEHAGTFDKRLGATVDITGTLTMTKDSALVVGNGTLFTTEFTAGKPIWIYAASEGWQLAGYSVASVQDNTHLTLNKLWWPASATGVAASRMAFARDDGIFLNANYYDLGLVVYNTYYRKGDPQHLTNARAIADSWWDSNVCVHGKLHPSDASAPRNISLGGLMLRALDGRPEMWPWITGYVRQQYQNWVLARVANSELAFGIRDGGYMQQYAAWLAKVHPDPAVRAEMTTKAVNGAVNYYARLQFPDGSFRWQEAPHAGGGFFTQPFMVGLLLGGLIATHRLIKDNPTYATQAATLRASILKAVDNWYNVLFDKTTVVTELGGAVKWRSAWYFYYGNNCATGCGGDSVAGSDRKLNNDINNLRGARQLNSTTLHAFGYAYWLTKDPKYLTWGDDVCAANFGAGTGPQSDPYRNLADFREKEFSQNYREGMKYLALRAGAAA